jgi:hypothetical protein
MAEPGWGIGWGRRVGRIRDDGVDEDFDSLLGLELHALHPEDAAIEFQYRPGGPCRARNAHPFQHLLDFARGSRVPEPDPVTRFPAAEQSGPGGLREPGNFGNGDAHADSPSGG